MRITDGWTAEVGRERVADPPFPATGLAPPLEEEAIEAVLAVLRSGWLTLGPRTAQLEAGVAEWLGVRHAVATSSTTGALHLALVAAGVGDGDEVVVPALAPPALATAVRLRGARPVPADVDPALGIDPREAERAVGPRTRAVCAVHVAGYPPATGPLAELCEARGPALIEAGAVRPAGLASVASFAADGILPGCEGALLLTDDDDAAELARSLRSHAMTAGSWSKFNGGSHGYDAERLGFNYRIDEPRAALALARLPRLDEEAERRRAQTHRLRPVLAELGARPSHDEADVERSRCVALPALASSRAGREDLIALLRGAHGLRSEPLAARVAATERAARPESAMAIAALALLVALPPASGTAPPAGSLDLLAA